MPIRRHEIKGSKSGIAHAAYDAETQHFYLMFPNGPYRYHEVPPHHFEALLKIKAIARAMETDPTIPAKDENGVSNGSEGSYLLFHIRGPRKGPAPFKFDRPDEWDASGVFEDL